MLQLQPGQHIHFIGIGGAGLSAIARIMLERGFKVSGSDLNAGANTEALAADGALIFAGHDAEYVRGADIVLASSAIPTGHVETVAAASADIPIFKRRTFMSAVLQGYDTIAVAGTHGKTTTTSMIIHILQHAGMDPSYIVGGNLGNSGKNAAVGTGDSFVIEADEYDNMFHGLAPNLAVITNVEYDHPDFFMTRADINSAFHKFVDLLAPQGVLVACADDEVTCELALKRHRQGGAVITYGISNPKANWAASDLRFGGEATEFTVTCRGVKQAELTIALPGAHNAANALAALIAANERGVSPATSADALRSFQPTARRFEIRGELNGVILVDDYAHHPTEIRVNIQAARMRFPDHRICAVWQPHTYTRVQRFWSDFARAFTGAHLVLVTPIYAAREAAVDDISSESLVEAMAQHVDATYVPTFDAAVETLQQSLRAPAVVLIFSAGDANRIADMYLGSRG